MNHGNGKIFLSEAVLDTTIMRFEAFLWSNGPIFRFQSVACWNTVIFLIRQIFF